MFRRPTLPTTLCCIVAQHPGLVPSFVARFHADYFGRHSSHNSPRGNIACNYCARPDFSERTNGYWAKDDRTGSDRHTLAYALPARVSVRKVSGQDCVRIDEHVILDDRGWMDDHSDTEMPETKVPPHYHPGGNDCMKNQERDRVDTLRHYRMTSAEKSMAQPMELDRTWNHSAQVRRTRARSQRRTSKPIGTDLPDPE